MPYEFSLSIGESFAELLAYSAGSPESFLRNRWYLPRKNLTDGLKEALKSFFPEGTEPQPIRLMVATSAVERILSQNQGRSPAVLVNSGFESELRQRGPMLSPTFSLRPERRSLPIEKDFIFGVSGRLAHDGSEQEPLRLEEFEQIATKLELLKIKDVVLAFLHSKRHPQHESQAAVFFRERGFRPVMSHQSQSPDRAIEAAFAESAVLEEKEQIETALKPYGGEWYVFGPNGLHPWQDYSASTVRGGLAKALKHFAEDSSSPLLHCGLDEFGVCASSDTPCSPRKVRPTQVIGHGLWPFPYLSEKSCGYAPGPMLFGKSQMLAAIDVLFACNHLQEIPGLTPLVSEKSRPRILEALYTLAKSSDTTTKRLPEPLTIAKSIERAFIEQVMVELQIQLQPILSGKPNSERKVRLTGALAETLKPHLEERRPDIRFEFDPADAWYETAAISKAAAKYDMEKRG